MDDKRTITAYDSIVIIIIFDNLFMAVSILCMHKYECVEYDFLKKPF